VLYCLSNMSLVQRLPVLRERSRGFALRKLFVISFAGVLVGCIATSVEAQAAKKPNYRVSVQVTSITSHTKVVPGRLYNIQLVIKNTGKKKIGKYQVRFSPGELMTYSSPTLKLLPQSDPAQHKKAARTFTNLRAGSTRRINVTLVFPACTASDGCACRLSLSVQGIGNSAFGTKGTPVYWK
jgi:hypothetical protein